MRSFVLGAPSDGEIYEAFHCYLHAFMQYGTCNASSCACVQGSCPHRGISTLVLSLEKCCGIISCTERETREEQQSLSCCNSSARAKVRTVLQLCAKLLLVFVNILYLVLLFAMGGHFMVGWYATTICAAWELVVIYIVAVVRVYCWLYRVWRKYEEPNLWGFYVLVTCRLRLSLFLLGMRVCFKELCDGLLWVSFDWVSM